LGIVPSAECLETQVAQMGRLSLGPPFRLPPVSAPGTRAVSTPRAVRVRSPTAHGPSQFPSGTRHSIPSESVPQWHTGREVTARRPGQYPLAHGPLVPCGVGDGPRTPGSRAVSAPVAHGPFRDRPTGRVSTPLAHGPSAPGGPGQCPGPGTRADGAPNVLVGSVPLAHGPLVPHRPAGPTGSRSAVTSRGRAVSTDESRSIRVTNDAWTIGPRGHLAIERASSESGLRIRVTRVVAGPPAATMGPVVLISHSESCRLILEPGYVPY
jgi:hypothetical protein